MAKYLYSTNDSEKIKEVIREAESLLEAQLTIATAADQRALTFAGLLIAAIAALFGAATASGQVAAHAAALLAVASALFVSAAFALWSARPTQWFPVGNEPRQWLDDITTEQDSMDDCLAAMAEWYDTAIQKNYAAIQRAARSMKISMFITGATMLSGLAWAWLTIACLR